MIGGLPSPKEDWSPFSELRLTCFGGRVVCRLSHVQPRDHVYVSNIQHLIELNFSHFPLVLFVRLLVQQLRSAVERLAIVKGDCGLGLLVLVWSAVSR